jgi:cupin 2 domain-containing protein
MTIRVDNFFAGLPASSEQEQFLTLFKSESIKIERIVSHSHSSPPGFGTTDRKMNG